MSLIKYLHLAGIYQDWKCRDQKQQKKDHMVLHIILAGFHSSGIAPAPTISILQDFYSPGA